LTRSAVAADPAGQPAGAVAKPRERRRLRQPGRGAGAMPAHPSRKLAQKKRLFASAYFRFLAPPDDFGVAGFSSAAG